LQSRYVGKYLSKVLQVKSGLDAKFEEFARVMESIKVFNFTEITIWLKSLIQSELFDQSGKITESRPLIFNTLETLVVKLSEGFASIRKYVDRLDIALKIKTDVFGFAPQYLTHRTDIEEIRSKMDSYSYLTVNHTEIDGKKVPIGVVHASEIQKEVLATVSLRDFCNREEMAIPSYIEVISVIDHHKSLLATKAPPTAFISDAQSTCTLLAEMACELNDKYSLSGMNWEEITSQLKELEKGLDSVPNIRLYQRLLQKKKLLSFPSSYFIDSRREYLEYLHFLYAILDDTDLLTKVTKRDVECAFSLLNRLKTLTLKKEVEVINFDQIKEEKEFTSLAAKALLQNEDFYSLYSKVYLFKEQSVEENLEQCAKRHSSNIFGDMKIMGGSSRVGQTKLFCSNIPLFSTLSPKLRRIWLEQSQKIYESSKEILLHLHMISTVASAGELFRGEEIEHFHLDEIWIWIPPKEIAEEYLKIFLSGLKTAPYIRDLKFSVQFLGENAEQLSLIFKESFFPISHEMKKEQKLSIAVLRFNAGKINSRKAMIVPYLPGGTKYT
ncbi:MAG: DHH family phosphoesterase, partial [Simkania negevensis]|nr:DHH family phosphoesterase [Simkania negevensis]